MQGRKKENSVQKNTLPSLPYVTHPPSPLVTSECTFKLFYYILTTFVVCGVSLQGSQSTPKKIEKFVMTPRRNHGVLALLLLAVAVASFSHSALGGSVYLSPLGQSTWRGDCENSQICSQSAPCAPQSGAVTTIAQSDACKIIFMTGNYAQSQISLAAQNSQILGIDFEIADQSANNVLVSNFSLYVSGAKSLDIGKVDGDTKARVANVAFFVSNIPTLTVGGIEGSASFAINRDSIAKLEVVMNRVSLSMPKEKNVWPFQNLMALVNFVGSAPNPKTEAVLFRLRNSEVHNIASYGVVRAAYPLKQVDVLNSVIDDFASFMWFNATLGADSSKLISGMHVTFYEAQATNARAMFESNQVISDFTNEFAFHLDSTLSIYSGFDFHGKGVQSTSLAPLYKDLCVHLNTNFDKFSLFELNCNHPGSTSPRHRCQVTLSSFSVDNRICFFGQPEAGHFAANSISGRYTLTGKNPSARIEVTDTHLHGFGHGLAFIRDYGLGLEDQKRTLQKFEISEKFTENVKVVVLPFDTPDTPQEPSQTEPTALKYKKNANPGKTENVKVVVLPFDTLDLLRKNLNQALPHLQLLQTL